MYITIRKYADKAGLIDGLVPPVRDGFVPLLRRAPGFRRYCAFASEDGHVVSVTLFDDRPSAIQANDQVREWVVSNLRDLLPNAPEVTSGEVLVHEEEEEARPESRSPGGENFVVIQYYDGLTGSPDRAAQWVRANLVPRLREQAGFRAFCTFVRDGNATRGGSVTLWDAAEAAVQSRRMGLLIDTARLTGFAREVPVVMMGRTAVAVTA